MPTAAEHYAALLSPVYLWMVGGIDAALAQGSAEIAPFCIPSVQSRAAVDLGAGFGMHAIPLARSGYAVTAIDTSAYLLSELRRHGAGLAIRTVQDDLLNFPQHRNSPPHLILCMGDTLTHLEHEGQVDELFSKIGQSIAPGGTVALTFRDYTNPPIGHGRFIPVRSDGDRILTCFLEASATHIEVHDVLYEREGPNWRMQVSSYKKLRLSPESVVNGLAIRGFEVCKELGPRGMVRIIATLS